MKKPYTVQVAIEEVREITVYAESIDDAELLVDTMVSELEFDGTGEITEAVAIERHAWPTEETD